MASPHEPAFGRSGNRVTREGSLVVKRHAEGQCLVELAAIARLADLPVPRVRTGTRPDELHLEFVDGLRATDAIEAGFASAVLRAMGEALRAIQAVPASRFGAAREDDVLVHGDFAPYNVIVSEDGETIRAILDWEAARPGSPITDVAWCVSQFRRLYPRYEYAVRHLFEGYGQAPDSVVIAAELERYSRSLATGSDHRARPTVSFRVIRFADMREGAAFVAAVSRAAGAPFRARPGEPPAEVWVAPESPGGLLALMNEPAAEVAASVFGAQTTTAEVARTLPPDARLAVLVTHTPSLGIDDVLAIV